MEDAFFKHHIFFCTNERQEGHKRGCCKSRNGEKLRAYMKARTKELGIENIRVNKAGCMDRCEAGPIVVVYPEGVWYSPKTIEDIDLIIESHINNDTPVEALRLSNED